jgi:hypothetical protein
MPFFRSASYNATGKIFTQINAITSFLDGSSIYGPNKEIHSFLRKSGVCEMITQPTSNGELLPLDGVVPPYMENYGNSRGKVRFCNSEN